VSQREDVRDALLGALDQPTFFEWQKMWIIATLMQSEKASKQAVKSAMSILSDATRHDALRAWQPSLSGAMVIMIGAKHSSGYTKMFRSTYGSRSIFRQEIGLP